MIVDHVVGRRQTSLVRTLTLRKSFIDWWCQFWMRHVVRMEILWELSLIRGRCVRLRGLESLSSTASELWVGVLRGPSLIVRYLILEY